MFMQLLDQVKKAINKQLKFGKYIVEDVIVVWQHYKAHIDKEHPRALKYYL